MQNEEKKKPKNQSPPNDGGFVDNLRAAAKFIEDVVDEREDVKNGEFSKEDILNSKAFMLFTAILNTSETTFIREDVQNLMVKIGESIGEEASQSLVQLLILLISTIAYDSISFYDEQLKREINSNFEPLIGNVNANHVDIKAQEEALKIYKARLDKFEKMLEAAQIIGSIKEEG